MKLDYRKIIYSKLKKAGKKPLTFKELLRSCRGKGFEFEKFTKVVDKMLMTSPSVQAPSPLKVLTRTISCGIAPLRYLPTTKISSSVSRFFTKP